MQLRDEYKIHQTIYNEGFAFDPEERCFFTDKELESFKKPEGYEEWTVKTFDFYQYGKERLKKLGVTDKNNEVLLNHHKGKQKLPVIEINQRGHIEILQYSLRRSVHTFLPQGKKGVKNEVENFQVRLHPWAEALTQDGGKYDGSRLKITPFWPELLLDVFEKKEHLKTLVLTEGQIKAIKGGMEGIPVAGLTSISHFRAKETKRVHSEIIEILKDCTCENLVILWDGDCREISLKQLEAGHDISARPGDFFRYAVSIRTEVLEYLPKGKKLNIFMAAIRSGDLHDPDDPKDIPPKGLDDLLEKFPKNAGAIRDELINVGEMPSLYFDVINITQEHGIKKLRTFFKLDWVQEFYRYHERKIKDKKFIWNGHTYKIKDGAPHLEIKGELREYMQIGTDYWRMKPTPVSGENGDIKVELRLVPWSKQAIIDRFGKNAPFQIAFYDGFTNIPSHTEYQPVIKNHWNVYFPVEHELETGEFPHIRKLLKHVFQEHYDNEMILDYLSILYRYPKQKLPVICLVSREQGTGKSTFLKLMKMIFKQNMAMVGNNDLMGDFNSHWITKLVVACEETILENKAGYEKIKFFTTASEIQINEKNRAAQPVECILHFLFCSNHEDDFIRIDDYDSRLWIRKVPVLTKDKNTANFDEELEKEIASFVNFIITREIKYEKKDRLWFLPRDFRTAAFENLVENSEPRVIKELRGHLRESFLKWGGETREMTSKDIKRWFQINVDTHYLDKEIKKYLNVKRRKDRLGKDTVVTYDFIVDDPANEEDKLLIKAKGRPFVFHANKILKRAEQLDIPYKKDNDAAPVESVETAEIPKEEDLPF